MSILSISELKKKYLFLTDKIIKEVRGEDTTSSTQITRDKNGNVTEWIEETRDLNGLLVLKRVDTYKYKESGEVDTIIQERIEEFIK